MTSEDHSGRERKDIIGDKDHKRTPEGGAQGTDAHCSEAAAHEVRDHAEVKGRLAVVYTCGDCGVRVVEDKRFVQAQLDGIRCSIACGCGVSVIVAPHFQMAPPTQADPKKTKGGIYVP